MLFGFVTTATQRVYSCLPCSPPPPAWSHRRNSFVTFSRELVVSVQAWPPHSAPQRHPQRQPPPRFWSRAATIVAPVPRVAIPSSTARSWSWLPPLAAAGLTRSAHVVRACAARHPPGSYTRPACAGRIQWIGGPRGHRRVRRRTAPSCGCGCCCRARSGGS